MWRDEAAHSKRRIIQLNALQGIHWEGNFEEGV